jgi:hypothetical protein
MDVKIDTLLEICTKYVSSKNKFCIKLYNLDISKDISKDFPQLYYLPFLIKRMLSSVYSSRFLKPYTRNSREKNNIEKKYFLHELSPTNEKKLSRFNRNFVMNIGNNKKALNYNSFNTGLYGFKINFNDFSNIYIYLAKKYNKKIATGVSGSTIDYISFFKLFNMDYDISLLFCIYFLVGGLHHTPFEIFLVTSTFTNEYYPFDDNDRTDPYDLEKIEALIKRCKSK